MTSQTITIPAGEVRPGDVLFGMTVETSATTAFGHEPMWFLRGEGFAMNVGPAQQVTVERPVPSDPIGTVRGNFNANGDCLDVYLKSADRDGYWHIDGNPEVYTDADVADFPILWKPGMPIPTEGVQS